MRSASLLAQVIAVISRRTPAFQPAPGQPSTFAGRLTQALNPTQRRAVAHQQRHPASVVVRDDVALGGLPEQVSMASELEADRHAREAVALSDTIMRGVSGAVSGLADELRGLGPEQRLRCRRFLPRDRIDAIVAAAAAYRAAAKFDVRLQQVVEAGRRDWAMSAIPRIRELARDVDRTGRSALRHVDAVSPTEQLLARSMGFLEKPDHETLAAMRRGLEVKDDLVDLDALAARRSRFRHQADVRLFAASRLLSPVSGMPVPDAIAQFALRIEDVLTRAPLITEARSSDAEELDELVDGIVAVRTLLGNVAGADLRDADLHGVPLVGVLWSSKTRWPSVLQDRIEADSVPVGDDLFEITESGTYRQAARTQSGPTV